MERGSSENRGAGGPAARRRPAPVGFVHASFYRRKPRHYTMAHNRSPLSRGSAEFWNQIAGHMLSAHRRAMPKNRGIRRIMVRKMNSKTIKRTILTSIGAIALNGSVNDPVNCERKK